MSSPTVPADTQPVAPAAPRRTRPTDVWTTIFLILVAALGAWSLVLIVLTLLAIAQPSFFYSDEKAALKALGASLVGLIAIEQAYTMGAAMNKVPRFGLRTWARRAARRVRRSTGSSDRPGSSRSPSSWRC